MIARLLMSKGKPVNETKLEASNRKKLTTFIHSKSEKYIPTHQRATTTVG